MKIEYIQGDLIKSPEMVIAHGCNAQGVMNSGVARAIREKYPRAYDDYYNHIHNNYKSDVLGSVAVTELHDRTILNIISQEYYGRNPKITYVSYDALANAIKSINDMGYKRIAFPRIGAGLGNGKWEIISAIIESYSNFSPVVYDYDPPKAPGANVE